MSKWRKFQTVVKVFSSSTLFLTACGVLTGNETAFKCFVFPINRHLSPEISQKLALYCCKFNIFQKENLKDDKKLQVKLLNFELSNPLGMAAGFDKNGEVADKLLELGFGFVEVGSVTPMAQKGNQKPRIFRLNEDKAIVHRCGKDNEGQDVIFERLKEIRDENRAKGLIGVNLGSNKITQDPIEDYVKGVKKFAFIADYLVIDARIKNSPGLRDIHDTKSLKNLLKSTISARNEISEEKSPPIFLKLTPDITRQELREIIELIKLEDCKVDGLIICNSTIYRDPRLKSRYAEECGVISGLPLKEISTKMIAEVYHLTEGKIPIIGVGGIFTGKDAFDKITAGATVVQIYTSFAFHGPFIIPKIKKQLLDYMEINGFKTVNEAVGSRKEHFL
ncbi:dihydroorotate dehydrogenase (quinone), mitochondrial-like [Culicoides brevitarsis]|uniref:dihydroorotate dehydrogenase (quinone), mitochondrial-like n=1 Tax=Culicoides brevitarsis TaxID=469753 RepID=UPI00307B421F